MAGGVKEEVLELEVAMGNPARAKETKGRGDLSDVQSTRALGQSTHLTKR